MAAKMMQSHSGCESGSENMMSRYSMGMLVAALILGSGAARADAVADFYKGKQVQMIIRSAPGGSYDQYGRLVGRHIGRHIPGNPLILPVNMPGGGGITAANYVANIAPKDGSVLTMVGQGLATDQALGLNNSLKFDLRDFNWIGNISNANQALWVWHTSKTKDLKDAMTRATVIGTTGAGSIAVFLPAVYNNVVGTRLKLIFGYIAGSAVDLAMERGEVEGRGSETLASYRAAKPHFLRDKLIIPIIQTGLTKDPGIDAPLLRDLAKTPEEKQIFDFMSKAVSVGRPFATSPGVPADRVAALRKAFDDMLKDPAFIAEAEREQAEIAPMNGAELAQVVKELIEAPADIRAKVKAAIELKKEDGKEIVGDRAVAQ